MKKMMILILALSLNVLAQTESVSTAPDIDLPGTIVAPTPQQKATIKKAAKKAKKAAKENPQPTAATSGSAPTAGRAGEPTSAPVTTSAPMSSPSSELAPQTAPAPVPETAQTEPTEVENKKSDSGSSSEPHRFGLHVDLNVPHILNYGLDYVHPSEWFSGAINFGGYSMSGLLKSTDLPNGLNVKIANQELMLRMHPLRGSFYFGLGYGNHTFNVETKQRITVTTPVPGSADVEISDEIKANYLLPHIGWAWRLSMGLTFGLDIGYLSPLNPSVDLKSKITNISNPAITSSDVETTNEYKNARRDLIDKSEQAGKTGLPFFTVFRIGWLF